VSLILIKTWRVSLSPEHCQEGYLGTKCENTLPPLVDLEIIGT